MYFGVTSGAPYRERRSYKDNRRPRIAELLPFEAIPLRSAQDTAAANLVYR